MLHFWLRGRALRQIYLLLIPVIILYIYFMSSKWPQRDPFLWRTEDHPIFPTTEPIGNEPIKRGCVIPNLNVNDPDIMSFFKRDSPISCGNDFDWVSLSRGKFIITSQAINRYGDVKCDMSNLKRQDDFHTVLGSVVKGVKNGTDLTDDFYLVECVAPNGTKYRNFHAGIHRKEEVLKRSNNHRDGKISLDLDVVIIGQDSLSHMAWIRHMPLTRSYLVDVLKATEMGGHTILGDGTPATMFPLLTGKREEDLPDGRRGYKGAKPVDGFPWIWKEFRKAGYVTAWQEDDSQIGTFHYRLMGFDEEPVDHYFRPFDIYTMAHKEGFKPNCYGSKPHNVVQYNYLKDVFDTYKGQRSWTFGFYSKNSHEDNNHASRIDQAMRQHLENLHDDGHLDNALLIVMADHGARFSEIRAFAQGKQEERMPYFAIRLPEKFKIKHPDIMRNIVHNSERLTSPFDVHETLLEVLDYTGSGDADISRRGVSLFKKIPIERDCKSADVDAHWCFCLDWSPVPITDDVIRLAIDEVIAMVNKFTEAQQDKCSRLALKQINSAAEYKVKDDVLKFKDTNDGGRGRFGKMTDRTKHSRMVYQITFVTTPGDGVFEVTISRDMKTKKFTTDLKAISRINEYGRTPWCIMDTIPQLRPYCVCKQSPLT